MKYYWLIIFNVAIVAEVTEKGIIKIIPTKGINKNNINTRPFPMAIPLLAFTN